MACRGPGGRTLPGDRIEKAKTVYMTCMSEDIVRLVLDGNPINRCPTVVVPVQEVERFERECVSLFAIARLRGRHPTADWIARQITETFPWNEAPRYMIRDRDGYGAGAHYPE
jgi:hypothetical protein